MKGPVDLDRERTRFLLERLGRSTPPSPDDIARYMGGVPVALRTQGLAVTLALLRDGASAQKEIARLIGQWLCTRWPAAPEGIDADKLLGRLDRLDPHLYQAMQAEALALCERLKLLSNALKKDRGGRP